MKNYLMILILSLFFVGCTHKKPIHITLPAEPYYFSVKFALKDGNFYLDRIGAENLKKNKIILSGYIDKLKNRINKCNEVFD